MAIVLLLLPVLVYAIGNPDSVTIGDVFVFQNVSITGDQLYFCRYDINYGTIPPEDPEDTWQMALYNTTDSLGGRIRSLNYYQHNIISIYLTPVQAITWGAANKIRIMGKPIVFGTLTEDVNMDTRVLSGTDYYDKASLASTMLAQAEILESDWGITLIGTSGKLNDTGGEVFLLAVPGLGSMALDIFEGVMGSIPINYVDYNHTYAETLKTNAGTKLDLAISDIAKLIGISNSEWMGFWLFMIFFLMLVGVTFAGLGNPGWAFIGGYSVIAVGGYLLGGSMFHLAVILVLVVAALFGLYFILSRYA